MKRLLLLIVFVTCTATPAMAVDGGGSKSSSSASPSAASSSAASSNSNSKYANTELNVIRTLIKQKNYSKALAALKIADQTYPYNADINNLLGFTSRKLKNYQDAAKYYVKALQIDPKHLGALEYQGELFLMTKKINDAKSNLAKLKSLCGTSCEQYLELKKAIENKS